MTLINLEDVQKMIREQPLRMNQSSLLHELMDEINSLPTHDPIAVLKEMIEEEQKNFDVNKKCRYAYRIQMLKEAISRITKQ